MAFIDYTSRLRQYVPALTVEQAEDYVNAAWRDIRQANDEWSFLFASEQWLSPAGITLNGLTTTDNSASVGLTWANLIQLANLNNPSLTQRQLRFGLSGGPIYSIVASDVQQVGDGAIAAATTTLNSASGLFSPTDAGLKVRVAGAGAAGADLDTTIAAYVSPTQVTVSLAASTTVTAATTSWGSSLTLDRLYREGSSSNGTALCYRIYYSPLSTDFQRLDHLVDPITGYEFGWEVATADELDRMDPQRGSVTQPYRLFYHGFDGSTGLPVYEMWPGPTVDRAYNVYYWKLGQDFSSDSDSLPPQIPEELLSLRARLLAFEWAMVAEEDPRRRLSYSNALGYVRSKYSTEGQPGRPLGLLDVAIRRDRGVAVSKFRSNSRNRAVGWPLDAAFIQRHGWPPGPWF